MRSLLHGPYWLIGFVLLNVHCDSAFSPEGPYKERMVVYSILTTRSDTQFVRVYRTRRNSEVSTEIQVPDAEVAITQGSTTFAFHDTTIVPSDTTGSSIGIRVYVSYRLHLDPGLRYDLAVTSPTRGSVSSQCVSLYRGTLTTEATTAGDIAVRVFPGVNATAYVVRLYIEYEVLRDSVWTVIRTEIPREMNAAGVSIYPTPVDRDVAIMVFAGSAYSTVISRIREEYGIVRLKRTLFVLTQLDNWLYAYYSVANGFPDSGTLRLDEPDFSNIQGGLGVFAATSETVVVRDTTGQM